jgi:peptidoglycan/xylan/chitin deacetylase (PgdA/CDA1 family)
MEISSTLSRWRQLVHSWIKFGLSYFVINKISRSDKVIYLTFDDGPCEKTTETIFSVLKEMGVGAGFFFNGDAVIHHRELVERIHSFGLFVGNHSYHHNRYTWKQWRQELDNIHKGEKIIESITHRGSKVFRPPFGSITPMTFLCLLIKKYKMVYWSIDSRDFEAHAIQDIMENIRDINSGDILLFHSDCGLTASNIRDIIKEISSQGYRFGNLADALQ